ncbi:MAG: outer membrane protein assembly factor BamA [Planctomycetes bacterium]|nr:outer membrane protein assembly factor BamA [Planctomycetota bacterium]
MKATERVTGGVGTPARRLSLALGGLLLGGTACLAQQVLPSAPADRPPTSPAKVMVADVRPQGLHNVPPGQVMALIQTRVGQEYKKATVEEDVRRLYQTRSFRNIQVVEQYTNDGNVIVYFQFQEVPSLVQDIIYQGAKHAGVDDLNGVTGLRKGVPLNPAANQQACFKIVQFYNEKGRPFASCQLVEGGHSSDSRVVFSITEGPIARVCSIDFVGNQFVNAARLRTQINSSAKFLHLNLGGKFNPAMTDNDVLKLEEYYRGFGYHDVRVARELQWEPDQQNVHVIFHIQEGARYKVHGVDVIGESTQPREQLLGLTQVKPGENIDQGKIKADLTRLQDYYGYRGSDPEIIENVVYRVDQPEADIQYKVVEKPPATVGQVIIVGNEVTKQNVILRQVPLYPGQVLTYPDLRLAERNLARLNIFENNPEQGIRPTVSVIDDNPENPVKDVLINVQETATGSLLFGVGVNSDAGLTGSIVLNERNFDILRPPTSLDDLLSGRAWRGGGQEFRIEAVPGTQLQRYTASWREPFLFDSPYSLGVSGYYYDRVFNEDTDSRLGARVTLGRKLNQYWNASLGLRVEEVGIHDVASWAPPDYLDVVGNNFLVGLRGDVTYDSRDSYLRATEGSMLDIGFEEVTGDYTFPVLSLEANKYFTIYQRPDQSGRHVLAYHGELAWAGSNTPVFERFFAGGFRSMRGFEFRGVGPFSDTGYNLGGDFMVLNSLEYQLPIKANDQIYLVGFVDSGTVESKISLADYRVSAGFGIRIVVPLLGPVPIALDFGFPIVKDPNDRTQVFSFWVGFFH